MRSPRRRRRRSPRARRRLQQSMPMVVRRRKRRARRRRNLLQLMQMVRRRRNPRTRTPRWKLTSQVRKTRRRRRKSTLIPTNEWVEKMAKLACCNIIASKFLVASIRDLLFCRMEHHFRLGAMSPLLLQSLEELEVLESFVPRIYNSWEVQFV
uniref:Uncharacterized protein n=1 Tax=Arundo donax TaxID=35708 RepID=A0A0A9EZ76_ARUDO